MLSWHIDNALLCVSCSLAMRLKGKHAWCLRSVGLQSNALFLWYSHLRLLCAVQMAGYSWPSCSMVPILRMPAHGVNYLLR